MHPRTRWLILLALACALVSIFVVRTLLAHTGNPPRLFDLFNAIAVIGALCVLAVDRRRLHRTDWLTGGAVGLLIAVIMPFTTLFNPYSFWGVVDGPVQQGIVRGVCVAIAVLGGLAIMRRGGPVRISLAVGGVRKAAVSLLFGALVGIPLAIVNMFANSWTQARPFAWQNPAAAALDALQPAVFEETVYRLALLGLFWLALRPSWGQKATWLAGAGALLVHTYAHYDDLFITQPVMSIVVGAALALIWGVPMTLLAVRRDLESAIGFHWIQDALRFWAGL